MGYPRGWFAKGAPVDFSTTFLGVRRDRTSHFNAVIYEVDSVELVATDKRELLYCRANVVPSDIKPLENQLLSVPSGQAWIYVALAQNAATPSARYPIVQSYVDIFVSTCLEQEQRAGLADYAQQCLATTGDWSEHWINDRIYPRRRFAYLPRARQIDTLLSKQLPQYFSHIKLEPGG